MNIVIIGGGIAGLTAAVALQQQGLSATVYEAASTPRATGKGIWLPSNALQVMARLGLAEAMYARGINIDRIELRNKNNTLLQHLDLASVRNRFGHGTLSIRRQDLHEQLQTALAPASLVLGKRCQTLQEHADSVEVTFADGSEVSCEVVIAADGVRSLARAHVTTHDTTHVTIHDNQPHVSPPQTNAPDTNAADTNLWRYAGQRCFLGIANVRLPDGLHHTVREIWGGQHRFGFSAVTPTQVYWFAPISTAQDAPVPNDIKAFLQSAYKDFPEPVMALLEHTAATDIITTDLGDIGNVNTWYSPRVVLIGDAAHAMTPNLGQGGAQAIEDAYMLAQALSQHSLEHAFTSYVIRRQRKAQRISLRARRFGQLAHLGQPWSTVRDACLRLIPNSVNQPALDSLYRLDG